MRCICVILDGLGDRGQVVFGGKTPLQAAHTPNLDQLARLGMNGLYHSSYQGVAMPRQVAHLLMFGYDIHELPGRGVLEAVGEGIRVSHGEVALLARIFCVNEEEGVLVLQQEDPDIETETCRILQKEIVRYEEGAVEIEFISTKVSEVVLSHPFAPSGQSRESKKGLACDQRGWDAAGRSDEAPAFLRREMRAEGALHCIRGGISWAMHPHRSELFQGERY
ncbi:MAG: hypothetical protein ACE5OR_15565 [bacterium]